MILRVSAICPECRQNFYAEVWQIVDLADDPNLRQRLLNGDINLPFCPHCGFRNISDMAFLVNDPIYKRVIFFIPKPLNEGESQADIQMLRNFLTIAIDPPQPYFETPVIVDDWDALMDLIAGRGDNTNVR